MFVSVVSIRRQATLVFLAQSFISWNVKHELPDAKQQLHAGEKLRWVDGTLCIARRHLSGSWSANGACSLLSSREILRHDKCLTSAHVVDCRHLSATSASLFLFELEYPHWIQPPSPGGAFSAKLIKLNMTDWLLERHVEHWKSTYTRNTSVVRNQRRHWSPRFIH